MVSGDQHLLPIDHDHVVGGEKLISICDFSVSGETVELSVTSVVATSNGLSWWCTAPMSVFVPNRVRSSSLLRSVLPYRVRVHCALGMGIEVTGEGQ